MIGFEFVLPAILGLPLVGAVLIFYFGFAPNARETVTLLTAGSLFALVTTLIDPVMAGERPEVVLFEMLPGLALALHAEPLGLIFALTASFLWIVTSVYSIGYMRGHHEKNQTRFYVFFAISITAAIGVAVAANLLTLFVFYEVLTLSTFPLVAHHGSDKAKRGARVYLGILMTTSILFLFVAIIWTYLATGTTDFTPGGILAGKVSGPAVGVLLALFAFGIGKAALMPFHRWLPAAMVAPTPVSALLHAVAVVKAGVFSVVKVIVYIFGIDFLAGEPSGGWLVWVAGFTIVAASLVALRQDNLKRRLAYSTISQLSYVILAAAILAPISVVGAAMHIAAHAFGKITLFFAAGSIMVASHKTEVSQLDGIGRRMPWTMGAFAVGAVSMIGLPPTVGFVSKWLIVDGAVATGNWVALGVIVLSTLLNAAYFLPVVHAAFFKPEEALPHGDSHSGDEEAHGHSVIHDHGESPLPSVLALTITAAGTVILFFTADAPLALARLLTGG